MAAASLIMRMVTFIGGNSINIRGKDMEQSYMLMVLLTWGNSSRMQLMVMEYVDWTQDLYNLDNLKIIFFMAMHLFLLLMIVKFLDGSRLIKVL
jgi:hypothetical protein